MHVFLPSNLYTDLEKKFLKKKKKKVKENVETSEKCNCVSMGDLRGREGKTLLPN